VRTEPAQRAPRSLGNHAQLAMLPREHGDDAICFPEIDTGEHDRFASVQSPGLPL
jgi:hypothetical protein